MVDATQKRQTAYKKRIIDILNAKYVKIEGLTPNYLETNGKSISRVNILATVVGKAELNNYTDFIIDDGSGEISARAFENTLMMDTINVGGVVQIIGRPREFSSEKYILIEIIKNVNPKWALVRRKELQSYKNQQIVEKLEGEVYDPGLANQLIKLIRDLDDGDGVSVEDISSKSIKDFDKILNTLLKEGDIFEVRPGKLKVLE